MKLGNLIPTALQNFVQQAAKQSYGLGKYLVSTFAPLTSQLSYLTSHVWGTQKSMTDFNVVSFTNGDAPTVTLKTNSEEP